jgi:DNA-directed RNA polymerase subunit RPC12/RpoP
LKDLGNVENQGGPNMKTKRRAVRKIAALALILTLAFFLLPTAFAAEEGAGEGEAEITTQVEEAGEDKGEEAEVEMGEKGEEAEVEAGEKGEEAEVEAGEKVEEGEVEAGEKVEEGEGEELHTHIPELDEGKINFEDCIVGGIIAAYRCSACGMELSELTEYRESSEHTFVHGSFHPAGPPELHEDYEDVCLIWNECSVCGADNPDISRILLYDVKGNSEDDGLITYTWKKGDPAKLDEKGQPQVATMEYKTCDNCGAVFASREGKPSGEDKMDTPATGDTTVPYILANIFTLFLLSGAVVFIYGKRQIVFAFIKK